MIFVLAGTTEGREAVTLLKNQGFTVGASVVSSYGSELLNNHGAAFINQGRLDRSALTQMLLEKEVSILVDGTHPYAIDVSKLAMEVAAELQIPYIRLERASVKLPESPLLTQVTAIEEIEALLRPKQRVFSTLGSKGLSTLVPIVKKADAELVVRVLPCIESLQICLELGINSGNIVALKGPFSKELNQALFKQYKTELMITKESGNIGGINEKIDAALELKIPIIVLTRLEMQYPIMVSTPEDLLSEIIENHNIKHKKRR